jgi:integrase
MNTPLTISDLLDRYQTWAAEYYRKPITRRPTGEAEQMRYAVLPLRKVAGDLSPAAMSAEILEQCQQTMVDCGLSRKVINSRINRIRRVWRWAVKPPRRWASPILLEDLRTIDPLKIGRTKAADYQDVQPVAEEHFRGLVAAVAEEGLLPRRGLWALQIATMLELHWYTGMRPGELCSMCKSELTDAGDLLLYKPVEHKTQHHGVERVIVIGQLGQSVLRPWLQRVKTDRVFAYRESSYRILIGRLTKRHHIPTFTPNQIRHSFATRMRALVGLEDTRPLLGHRHASTTEIYAQADKQKTIDVMRRFG